MVDFGAECTAGIGGLSYPGKIVRHIPPLDGVGYTNVIIPAFAADYTFYYIIGEADGKGQQYLAVTNRIEHLRRQRGIVSAVNQDVAADCSECLAGCRFGTDRSSLYRLNFTVFRRGIPDKAVRSEFCHHQRYTGAGNHPDRLFGGGELASAVPGLSISVDLDHTVVLSEKEYRSPTRPCNSFGKRQNCYC